MMLVQVLGGDQLQDGVTQIFKALVVAWRQVRTLIGERAVSDSLQQETRVAEVDSDFLLKQLQGRGKRGRELCYEPDFSWMYSQAWPTVVIFSASSSGISRPVFSSNA